MTTNSKFFIQQMDILVTRPIASSNIMVKLFFFNVSEYAFLVPAYFLVLHHTYDISGAFPYISYKHPWRVAQLCHFRLNCDECLKNITSNNKPYNYSNPIIPSEVIKKSVVKLFQCFFVLRHSEFISSLMTCKCNRAILGSA